MVFALAIIHIKILPNLQNVELRYRWKTARALVKIVFFFCSYSIHQFRSQFFEFLFKLHFSQILKRKF